MIEYREDVVSNCCDAPIIDNTDVCSACLEHCEPIPVDEDGSEDEYNKASSNAGEIL